MRDRGEIGADLLEDGAVEPHLVHLVDRHDDLRNREQRRDGGMPARLRRDSARGVHEDDGEIRGARARDHVARVLLVAGRVGDDEAAPRRREVTVGDVDGDALLAFEREPVGEEREVEAARAAPRGGLRNGCQLVLEQSLGVEQEAPDERALAVVDRSRGGEAQSVHQK